MIDKCDLFISNDSGLMHVAAAVKTPVIGLFGPTIPLKNHPWGDKNMNITIHSPHFCAPCYTLTDKVVCNHNKCMDYITVEAVLSATEEIIEHLDH